MVVSCSALNCTQRFVKGDGISFFSFPKNEQQLKLWVRAMGRKNFKPTKHSSLCSKHFHDEDIERRFGRVKLKNCAVPSLFDISSARIKFCENTISPISSPIVPDSVSVSTRAQETTEMGIKCYLCDQVPDREKKISLHRFPCASKEREGVLSVWVAACNLDEKDETSKLRLCSRHFRKDDFIFDNQHIMKKLKVLAVPSIKVPNPSASREYNETVTIEDRNNAELQRRNRRKLLLAKRAHQLMEDHSYTSDEYCEDEVQTSPEESHNFHCIVPHCSSRSSDNVSFYHFPKEEDRQKKWIHKLNLKEILTDNMRICSLHFRDEDILASTDNKSESRLRKSAEPLLDLSLNPNSNDKDLTSLGGNIEPNEQYRIHEINESIEDELLKMDVSTQRSTSTINGHLRDVNTSVENISEELILNSSINSSTHAQSNIPAIASVITKDSFKEWCRCCLINKGEINVFEAHFQDLPFSDLIQFCTTEMISPNEDLPKLICNICMQLIVSSYTFIKTVKDSQIHLKELQNSFKEKYEINNDEISMDINNASSSEINRNTLKRNANSDAKCFKHKFRKLNGIYKEVCDVLEKNRKEINRPERTMYLNLDRGLIKMFTNRKDTKGSGKGTFYSLAKSLSTEEVIVDDSELTVEVHSLPSDVMESNLKRIVDAGIENLDISYNNGEAKVSIIPKKVPEFLCFECSEHFPTEAHFIRHSKETGHINPARFKCRFCFATFPLRRLYSSHLTTHKEDTKVMCEICGVSVAPCNLNRHLKTHTTKGRHVCQVCNREFGHKGNLDLHMKYKHIESDDSLCFLCGKTFRNLAMLNRHLNSQHVDENLEQKSYSCPKCKKFFATETSLKHHRNCDGDKTSDQNKSLNQKSISRRCPICSRCFLGIGLKIHLRYAHQEKPRFQCTLCPKSFRVAVNLKRHLLKHNAGMPYKCTYCAKTFRIKRYFDYHVRSHSGVTSYDCRICDKTFSHILLMQKHQQSHFTSNGNNEINEEIVEEPTDNCYA